ncbi:MAG: Asp-tRNA(Asn)/Glu-tRNA(Gln) amidotransferase subunit GatC [Steroidobacterales bacterium]
MPLTRNDIENIAHLARLALPEEQIPLYLESLPRIIELVGELERADTSKVEPMAHPLPGQRQRLRADEVTETDRRELYQRSAPQSEAGLYLVPRVIE